MEKGHSIRHFHKFLAFCLLFIVWVPWRVHANDGQPVHILFVLDASGSMKSKWGNTTRMAAAKKILINLVDSLKDIDNVEIALRCYGFQNTVAEHNCKDTKLVVPFSAHNSEAIIKFVRNVKPNGYTPIAYSLAESAQDFPAGHAKNVVILITDGIEECDGEPCVVSKQLQARNIILRPYIVGIGIEEKTMKFFDCVGKYYLPQNERDLGQILSNVVSEAINNTTVVVQLMDDKGNPTQTDAEMCFTNAKNGKVEYNFYHTLTSDGKPDTFSIEPAMIYNLQVNTDPPVFLKNINLKGAQNNIITLKAPMGYLEIKSSSYQEQDARCLIKRAGSATILNVQSLNTVNRYLTGTYDIDILVLPRLSFKNVTVSEGTANAIGIPQSGSLNIDYKTDAIGQLFVKRNNILEYVIDINGAGTIRKESMKLQPGNYIIIYRKKDSNKVSDTKEVPFDIISGGSRSISLY